MKGGAIAGCDSLLVDCHDVGEVGALPNLMQIIQVASRLNFVELKVITA